MKAMINKIALCAFLSFLKLYQVVISPYIKSSCRFYPSCSEYTKLAAKRFGLRGIFLGIMRILRCTPFSKGGYDPIPQKFLSHESHF